MDSARVGTTGLKRTLNSTSMIYNGNNALMTLHFFGKAVLDKLVCISGSYFDYILQAGTDEKKLKVQSNFKETLDAT